MKQFIHIAAFAAAIVFSGCEPVDLTDHGRAPESIGPVTVNRERIGTGQPFTATCVIPADGHNISSVEYNWSIRPVAAQAAVADVTRTSPVPPHVEEKQFTAPLTAGSYVIGCTARYIFGAPDAEGNVYKDVTAEARIEVVPCDVLRSFWGDSMQETELNYPGLTAQGEDALVGMVYDPLQSGQPNIVTGFQFTDGRLARILQTEGADVSRGSGFYMHYLLLHHHITTGTSLMLACDSAVIAWTDGTEETPDMENDNKDREKQARIDAGFAAGEVTIRSVFHSDSYTLTLNVLKAGEQVVYDRTYTPRRAQ